MPLPSELYAVIWADVDEPVARAASVPSRVGVTAYHAVCSLK